MTAADKLAALSGPERDTVLALLDELSKPLTRDELNTAFAKAGVARTARRPILRALLGAFDIIVLMPLVAEND